MTLMRPSVSAQHHARPSIDRSIRAWHLVLLAAFMLVWIYAAIGSNGMYDGYRDMFMAESIVSRTAFPLNGPVIGYIFHLGPAWYYLLAAPLLLFHNPAMVNATVGLLGSLQFPLAYQLGRRFESSRLGILFALALALPGWSAFQLVMLTHVCVVVTCSLFGALTTWRYREHPCSARAVVLGLALSSMLHAHPTTILLIGIFAVAAITATPASRRLAHVGVAICAALLPFVPMFAYQAMHGWPDLTSASAYASNGLAMPSVSRAARICLALTDYGANYVAHYWLELPRFALHGLRALNATYFVAAAAGIALLVRFDRRRLHWVLALLAIVLVQALFLTIIREITPFWMVFAQLPLIAAVVALGLDRLCEGSLGRYVFVVVLASSWTLWSIASWLWIASSPWQGIEGVAKHPRHGLMEITEHQTLEVPFRTARIPVSQLFTIAPHTCAPITLYAHYALFIDKSFGIGAIARCGNADMIRLGGMPQAGVPARVGLRDYTWQHIGLTPEYFLGALGISPPANVWHSPQAMPVVKGFSYPPHQLDIDTREFQVDGQARGDQVVVVAFRALDYGPFRVIEARADGQPIAPVWKDEATTIFRAPDSLHDAGAVSWKIRINATPAYVDVLTLADAQEKNVSR